jgi:hypothetical protein
MKQILFIHPLGQTFAFVFGVFNAITGITRKWFNLAIHINCGAIYYFIALLGAGMGSFVSKWAQANGFVYEMELHEMTAMVMVLLLATGATTGIAMLRSIARRNRLLRYHRWINLCGLLLFCVQGASGCVMLFRLLRG